MDSWHATFLGLRRLPREITAFEIEVFFRFSAAERRMIEERWRPELKLGLALQIGFVRMSGRLLEAIRIVPPLLWRHLGSQFGVAAPDLASLQAMYRRAPTLIDTIPDERDEAIRDLCRAREDAVRARLKARQQLKAMLLRHGRRYTGRSSWTVAHELYLASVSFKYPAQDIAYAEYRSAVREANERVENLTQAMSAQLEDWRMRPVVEALMTLRGIDMVAAMTLVAEIRDFTRFARPRELMGFLGVVPSEHTSGPKRQQGEITKTGNSHARRVLAEAAWNYRFPARMSAILQRRQEGQPKAVRQIAWRAQLRKICVAIARELSGFIRDIARQVKPLVS